MDVEGCAGIKRKTNSQFPFMVLVVQICTGCVEEKALINLSVHYLLSTKYQMLAGEESGTL